MPNEYFKAPLGMTMENFMWAPAPVGEEGEVDLPLPNLAAFDRLHEEGEPARLSWLSDWVESHQTCTYILRHHGPKGLKRVIRGIARACSQHKVHMGTRVKACAEACEYAVY
jgi:hypothetical protein